MISSFEIQYELFPHCLISVKGKNKTLNITKTAISKLQQKCVSSILHTEPKLLHLMPICLCVCLRKSWLASNAGQISNQPYFSHSIPINSWSPTSHTAEVTIINLISSSINESDMRVCAPGFRCLSDWHHVYLTCTTGALRSL